jgi:RNA polymerase sigma factor (sigma-70 family)
MEPSYWKTAMRDRQLNNVVRQIRRTVAARQTKELPDRELLERFVTHQDEDAFAAIVKRHGALVLGVCRRILCNDHDAEDACQATFLVLTRKARTITKRDSLASWLYGVASRIAGKLRARVKRTAAEDVSAAQVAGPDIIGEITWREGLAVLDEELNRLPAAYRSALILCYLEGRRQDEAARELGCSLGVLCGRLVRARESLRKRLVRRGVPVPAALVGMVLVSFHARAALPAALAVRTAKAAASLLAGQPLARIVPPGIATLTEGALTSMFINRVRTIGVLVLAASLFATGTGLLTGAAGKADQPPLGNAAQPVQAAKDVQQTEGGLRDAFGDTLPSGAVARLGTIRWRHSTPIHFLALPTATIAVSAAKDRFVRVWDWSSGRELRRFGPGPRARESTDGFAVLGRPTEMVVGVSANGEVLVTKFAEPVVDLWQVATGKKLASVSLTKTEMQAVGFALSPKGKKLALCSANGKVRIWDIDGQKNIREFGQASDKSAQSVAAHYTPDGKSLISARTEFDVGATVGHMQLWDPETGRQLRNLRLTSRFGPLSFVCSPDSKLLAYLWDGQLCIVKTATGETVSQWKSYGAAMVFAADSSKLYCKLGHEAVIREYDVGTGKELRRFDTTSVPSFYWRSETTASIAVSPDGKRLAVGGDTNAIRMVDVKTGKELPAPGGLADDLKHVGFMPDGKSVFSAANLGASIWDAGTGTRLKQVRSEEDGHFAVSLDSRYFASISRRLDIVVRDTISNKPVLTIPSGKNPDNFPVVCLSPHGRIVLVRGLGDSFAVLHDLPSGKERCRVAITNLTRTPGRAADTFFFSADDSRLAVFSPGNRLAIHDATTGKSLQEITLDLDADNIVRWEGRLREIRSAAFTPDGRAIAIDRGDGSVDLLELASAQPRRTFGQKHVYPGLYEPFGAITSKTVESQMPGAGTVAFSPDGRLLAQAAVDHVVRVWDVATGKWLARFQGHRGAVFSVAFSPDGRRLVSGSADTTALIWDVDGLSAKASPARRVLSAVTAQSHWNDLAAEARTAADAMNALTASPAEALSVCQTHLRPVPAADAAAVTRLIGQLDRKPFKMRDKAQADLLALGDVVVPYLEKALAGSLGLETRQRLEKLHAKLTAAVLTGDRLRFIRAIEVLERIGSVEARRLLQILADGAPGALVTTQARAALQRTAKRG